jgi:hypothetical protein
MILRGVVVDYNVGASLSPRTSGLPRWLLDQIRAL